MIVLLPLFLLLDGALYFLLAAAAGPGPVFICAIVTTLAGLILLRSRTGPSIKRLIRTVRKGDPIDAAFLTVARVIISGILLVIPGLLTDIIGLLAALPVIGPALCLMTVPVLQIVLRRRSAGLGTDPDMINVDSRDIAEESSDSLPAATLDQQTD